MTTGLPDSEHEDPWRQLLSQQSSTTWTASAADGTVLSMQSVSAVRADRAAKSVVGRPWWDFVHPDDLPAARAAWDRVILGSGVEVLECNIRRADDTWVRVRQVLVADNRSRQVVGVTQDLTAEQLMIETHPQDASKFRARFADSALPQLTLDRSGAVSEVNDSFCALVGSEREALVGRPIGDFTLPLDGQGACMLMSLLAGAAVNGTVERLLTSHDQLEVPVFVDATVIRNDAGEVLGAAAFLHVLTSARESELRHQQQEIFFAALSRLSGDMAVVADREGRLTYVSPGMARAMGCSPADALALDVWQWVHPDDLDALKEDYREVTRAGGSRRTSYRFRTDDGPWRWAEQTTTNMLDEAIGGMVCTLRDITTQVETDAALRESEAHYRAITDTAEEGIWTIERTGKTLYANQRMATMLGKPLPELYRRKATELLDPDSAAVMRDRLANRGALGPERYEVAYQHPVLGERWFWIAASPLPSVGTTPAGSLAMVSDVTETRRLEQELRRAGFHDALTGLANRVLFNDRLEHALTRDAIATAVLLIDLDHFKDVNDSLGRAAGDQLLVTAAERVVRAVRPQDTVARFGGDEFAVVLEDVSAESASEIATEILRALEEPMMSEGVALQLGASVGLALTPPEDASELLRFAHTAMHAAKHAGRGRVRLFERGMAEAAKQRFALAGDLRAALAEDELDMHFQPVVDLQSGQVLGMEGLARWDHAQLGALTPSQFVPIAASMGLGAQLDRWAIRAAIRGAQALRSAQALPASAYVAINLTADNLSDVGLEELLAVELESAGMAPENLMLEISESSMVREPGRALDVLRRLHDRGYGLAIDNFGTGHSSLTHVRDLPVTTLKIDRSLVADMRSDTDALAIVTSILDLARTVGVRAIAEGVETKEQCRLLRGLGCRAAQGWLWAKGEGLADLLDSGGWQVPFDTGTAAASVPRRRQPSPVSAEHGLDRLLELHRKGASLATIAAALNVDGYLTPKGLRWHTASVARAIADVVSPLANRPSADPS